jgi:hypothetical protein
VHPQRRGDGARLFEGQNSGTVNALNDELEDGYALKRTWEEDNDGSPLDPIALRGREFGTDRCLGLRFDTRLGGVKATAPHSFCHDNHNGTRRGQELGLSPSSSAYEKSTAIFEMVFHQHVNGGDHIFNHGIWGDPNAKFEPGG